MSPKSEVQLPTGKSGNSGKSKDPRGSLPARVHAYGAGTSVAIALLGLIGNLPGLGKFGFHISDGIAMAPGTALGFSALGCILLILAWRPLSRESLALAGALTGIICLFGLLVVIGHLTGRLLAVEITPAPGLGQLDEFTTVWASLGAGVIFFLVGSSVLILLLRKSGLMPPMARFTYWSAGLGTLVTCIALVSCLVHINGIPFLSGMGATVPMALPSALVSLFLGITVVGASANARICRNMQADSPADREHLNAQSRLFLLTYIMIMACVLVLGIVIVVLYHHSIQHHRDFLQITVRSKARSIESKARYDIKVAEMLRDEDPEHDPTTATLSQVFDEHDRYKGFGETGEFTLVKREGNRIIFLLQHRYSKADTPNEVPFDSQLAIPMRMALEGQSGTMIGKDYRGVQVVAAFEPVAVLNLGIVAKIDLAEVRAPFIRAGLTSAAVAIVVVLTGMALFSNIGHPIILQLEKQSKDLRSEVLQRRESELKLKTFMESATEGFAVYDADLKLISINKTALSMLDIPGTEDTLKGKTIQEITPQPLHTGIVEHHNEILDSGKPVRWEDSLQVDGSKDRHLMIHAFKTGNGIGMIYTDITEIKLAESELSKAEERFRTICDNAPALINGFDRNGRCVLWNKQCRETFGWTFDEVRAQENALMLFYPDPEVHANVLKTFTTDPDGQFREWHPLTKDNRILTTMWANFRVPSGEVFSLGLDITDQQQAEDALEVALERYRFLADNTLDIIWVLDMDLNFTYVNLAISQATGFTVDELIGSNLSEFCDQENYNLMRQIITEELEVGLDSEGVVFEAALLKKDGTEFMAEIRGKIIFEESGSPIALQGTTRDIGERKKAEEDLKRYQDQLETRVGERTEELRKVVRLMAGRENRMAELKEMIAALSKQLTEAGITPVVDPSSSPGANE